MVRCAWSSAGPDARYEVVRETKGGRRATVVFTPGGKVLEDTSVAAGTGYAYRVRAVDAGGRTVGTSRPAKVWCCGAKPAGTAGK